MTPTLALDLPHHVYGFVDRHFLSAGERDGWEPAVWFGLTCPRNRAFGLSVLLECGAVYRELPPHAFAFIDPPSTWDIHAAQAWDCFGGSAQVLEYSYLREFPVMVLQGGRIGSYLFTVEFGEDGFSRYPGQAKCLHAVELDNGRLTFQPTWLRRNTEAWGVETWSN